MLKPLSLSSTTSAVSLQDKAFDLEASDLEAYTNDARRNPSCWREHLKTKDGEKPTVFVIGVIPPSEMVRIEDECRGSGRFEEIQWRSFLHSLRDIEGFAKDVPKTSNGDEDYVDPEWLRKTFIRGLKSVALEIGARAWWWNQITEEEVKN